MAFVFVSLFMRNCFRERKIPVKIQYSYGSILRKHSISKSEPSDLSVLNNKVSINRWYPLCFVKVIEMRVLALCREIMILMSISDSRFQKYSQT